MTFFGNIKVFNHDVLFHRPAVPPETELVYDLRPIPVFKAMIGNSCAAAKSALIRQREIGPLSYHRNAQSGVSAGPASGALRQPRGCR
jgi:hypothetical protein